MNKATDTKTMEYKGYTATVEWDDEAKQWCGEVLDIWGMVIFQGDTWEETYQAFKETLDSHIKVCEGDGEEPRMSNRELLAHTV